LPLLLLWRFRLRIGDRARRERLCQHTERFAWRRGLLVSRFESMRCALLDTFRALLEFVILCKGTDEEW
jgi:hypothetical protein